MADKTYKYDDGGFSPADTALTLPDEAVYYIVSNFLQERTARSGGSPVVVGVTTADVENVIQLFIDWAAKNGYIKDGILTIGG